METTETGILKNGFPFFEGERRWRLIKANALDVVTVTLSAPWV
jgi:hypothetical protein